MIRSNDGRPFRLLGFDCGAGEVEVRGVPSAVRSPRHVVGLIFRGSPATRRFAVGKATLTTDHPEVPTIQITWSAILKTAITPAETPAMPGVVRLVSRSLEGGGIAP